jgi:hypothetical protein
MDFSQFAGHNDFFLFRTEIVSQGLSCTAATMKHIRMPDDRGCASSLADTESSTQLLRPQRSLCITAFVPEVQPALRGNDRGTISISSGPSFSKTGNVLQILRVLWVRIRTGAASDSVQQRSDTRSWLRDDPTSSVDAGAYVLEPACGSTSRLFHFVSRGPEPYIL